MFGRVAECGWFPDGTGAELEDIAVLILEEPLYEIPHAGLAPVEPPEDATCYAYGSLGGYVGTGQIVKARITALTNDSFWHQLNADPSPGGYFVKRGFSGAPVLDPLSVTIWGMVVAVDQGADEEKRLVAFALPAGALRDAHVAVKRCPGRSSRPTPEITVRPDGPLNSLARETVVQLTTATIQASGLTPEICTGPAEIADDLVDAVRSLAAAGRQPDARAFAEKGLRGLQTGDTRPAERFFGTRLKAAATADSSSTINDQSAS